MKDAPGSRRKKGAGRNTGHLLLHRGVRTAGLLLFSIVLLGCSVSDDDREQPTAADVHRASADAANTAAAWLLRQWSFALDVDEASMRPVYKTTERQRLEIRGLSLSEMATQTGEALTVSLTAETEDSYTLHWQFDGPSEITDGSRELEDGEQTIEMPIPEEAFSGYYELLLTLSDEDGTTVLQAVAAEELRISRGADDMEDLREENWQVSDGRTLGRSALRAPLVEEAGGVRLRLPGGEDDGAELQHESASGYGSYEAKMRLPDAPGSITGFFLYAPPDYYYEIDIEVFNQADDSEIWLTTYEDGDTARQEKLPMERDPTASFLEYRFDYYPDELRFYLEGELLAAWEDGYPHEDMPLMINAWYPAWLEGNSTEEDTYLELDWVRW
ncbi:glycoside hydrolase family 16 protein [Alkalicoccus chagannorensis]|uniref:glycoside hydrolase family 16 protein n=1 Tax=Alkalicoccus chagannorensis TaxID=427072 RepID=UPI000427CAEF|nr:glycoside hydrolase family 16 protein [Alkalicoccus chagannorensis]